MGAGCAAVGSTVAADMTARPRQNILRFIESHRPRAAAPIPGSSGRARASLFGASRLPEWMSKTDKVTLRRYPQRVKEARRAPSLSAIPRVRFQEDRMTGQGSLQWVRQLAARMNTLKAEGIDANLAAPVNRLVQCEPVIDSRVATLSRVCATPGIARCCILHKCLRRIELSRTPRSQSGQKPPVEAPFRWVPIVKPQHEIGVIRQPTRQNTARG